jgi:hypothetical protein
MSSFVTIALIAGSTVFATISQGTDMLLFNPLSFIGKTDLYITIVILPDWIKADETVEEIARLAE